MNKVHLDFRSLKKSKYKGVLTAVIGFFAVAGLFYALLHNPYLEFHEQIFKTADNVRSYYADRPGYWNLSTESAIADRLIENGLLKHKGIVVKIGKGANGDTVMPADVTFDIALNNLNKSSCIALAEAKISESRQLGLQKITIMNNAGSTEFAWGDENHSLPLAKYAARNICQPTANTVLWTFQ